MPVIFHNSETLEFLFRVQKLPDDRSQLEGLVYIVEPIAQLPESRTLG